MHADTSSYLDRYEAHADLFAPTQQQLHLLSVQWTNKQIENENIAV